MNQVPTSFDDKIQFASLDVPTELCLHCACSKSIELMLEKSAVRRTKAHPSTAEATRVSDHAFGFGTAPRPGSK